MQYNPPQQTPEQAWQINSWMRNNEFMDALQMQQETMRLHAMRNDPEMQRAWNHYKKTTKGLPDNSRMTQDQFLMSIHKTEGYKGGQGTRSSARHENS